MEKSRCQFDSAITARVAEEMDARGLDSADFTSEQVAERENAFEKNLLASPPSDYNRAHGRPAISAAPEWRMSHD
jgi:hypothetical protein